MTVKFSVLMVTYDGEDEIRLERCLKSIESQTLLPAETIICLDGEIRESLINVINMYISRIFITLVKNTTFEWHITNKTPDLITFSLKFYW